MTSSRSSVPPGFHEGELAVQERAGVQGEAARLARMLDPADLRDGAARFLSTQEFAVLTTRDASGRLWISPVAGPAGFLQVVDPQTLRVHSLPGLGDPLRDLPIDQPVGLLVIDFARRRRFRINGWLAALAVDGLTIDVDQAYGNCPQYIHQRDLVIGSEATASEGLGSPMSSVMTERGIDLVRAADTFFLGTTHPTRGNDASHRGGPPGFVRINEDGQLSWPDYPGNNMFNSFGNLAIDPTAALLICDFESGRTLQLSGTAVVESTSLGAPGDDGRTGRRVNFKIERTTLR